MADTQSEARSIFRQSAMSRIASTDDLDKYIRVTNPSAWLVLLAAIMLSIGLIIWSNVAVIPTTVSVTGLAQDGQITCWVDEETADKMRDGGSYITVADKRASNVQVQDMPLSASEVKNLTESDYLVEGITLSQWNYAVTMEAPKGIADSDVAHLVPVEITVAEEHPISLVLGDR